MWFVQPGQQQRLMPTMWMYDEMIISKIYAPLGATAWNLVYRSKIGWPFKNDSCNVYLVCSKKNRLKKKKIVKTLGTLFCSTIDPLLIHLLCPLCSWKQMPFLCLLCNDTQSLQPLSLYTPKGVKYNHCSQEIMTSLISVLHSGKGLYLTVYPSSRPKTDTNCTMYTLWLLYSQYSL